MTIIVTNLITIILLLGTIIVLISKTKWQGSNSLSQVQLVFSFFLLILGITADTLFHFGHGEIYDTYGEYINLLFFPLVIFSIFTFSINRELEKRKQSEAQLQIQNENLLKANMELDSFVYRVSHDLRSPICSSMGLTNLCINSSDIVEIKYYLSLQDKSLKRLDQFIIDILNYSKNSHSEIAAEPIDFDHLIDSAFYDYKNPNREYIQLVKNLHINTAFNSDLLRLKIIFNNLISNAIKFQKEKELNPKVEINIQTTTENAIIEIRDNGIGIPDKFKSEVFKIFFRGTNVATGSGLGLYIVNDCVKRINGTIELLSDLNTGTTIRVIVPNSLEYN
jgi:signal transduction histidine kinase